MQVDRYIRAYYKQTEALGFEIQLPPDATNLSGFTGLPGGNRDFGGGYYNVNIFGYWWASSSFNTTSAWGRYLVNDDFAVSRDAFDKHSGFSIRCLKD